MFPHRGLNDGPAARGGIRPMFLRQQISRAALCRALSSAPQPVLPSPSPPWSARGRPPLPPLLSLPHVQQSRHLHPNPRHLHPSTQQQPLFSGQRFHAPRGRPGSSFSPSYRFLHTSAGLMMEGPDREKGPPQKRRKSAEEKSVPGQEGQRGGKTKGEHRQPDYTHSADTQPQSKQQQRFREGSGDRSRNGSGKGSNRDNASQPQRTKSLDRQPDRHTDRQADRQPDRQPDRHADRQPDRQPDRQRTDSRDGAANKGRSTSHHRGDSKDTHTEKSRTQTPNKSKSQKDGGSTHTPNACFKEKGAEDDTPQSNAWQVAGANNQLASHGTSPPGWNQGGGHTAKALDRRWECIPSYITSLQSAGGSSDVTSFDFSVMSYNILSQQLLHDNAYLYKHCHPDVLPWKHRLPNLLAEIQTHSADILCLQEVQEDHYENQIKPVLLALGYQCEYKKRTGDKPDGCAVAFKRSRLSLLLPANPVEFFRAGDALLDRDNVGLVLLLRPNNATDPSSYICVANTHLLYNPRRGDIKLAQLAILLAEIRRLSRLPDGSANPVVLCGDFNSTPISPLYHFLTTGRLEYKGMPIGMVSGQENSPRGNRLLTFPIWSQSLGIDRQCRYISSSNSPTEVEGAISNLTVEDLANKAAAAVHKPWIEHSLKLQSSYQHRLTDGRPEITTCHSRTAITVDYIMFTPEPPSVPVLPGGRGLKLLARLGLVGLSELEEVNSLPSELHSSDHLPLLAMFRYKH